jgi:O-antigen/teichoic acid export membrane protein
MAFGGPGYRSGASVLVVMAGASVAVSLNNAFGSLLLSRGVVRVRMAGEWLLAIVMVGASLVLIPLHGAMGLAVAHVLAYSASSVLAGLAEYWQSRPAAPTNALHGLHGRRDLR